MAAFAPCLAFTLRAENGFSNDPQDPGGPTNFGITLAGLSAWRGCQCHAEDVRDMQREEAADIYALRYWDPVGGPRLPAGLDLCVFDFGVNTGPETSVRMLQRLLGVDVDGVSGAQTQAAAAGSGDTVSKRIVALSKVHLGYYHALPGYPHDGRGWTARVNACQATALSLVGGINVPPVPPALPKPRATTPDTGVISWPF